MDGGRWTGENGETHLRGQRRCSDPRHRQAIFYHLASTVYRLPSTIHSPPLSNPLSLLPFALAAGNGRVDGVPAAAWVSAGFTLLQRSAPLVRALAGRRSAILLPPTGAGLTAFAASDGRGAVLLDPETARAELARQLADAAVGAVFTTRTLASRLPAGAWAVVLLDDAPRAAVVVAGGTETRVDLGSHFGLALEGEEDEGSDEECAVLYVARGAGAPLGVVHSHGSLLAAARSVVDATSMLSGDHLLAALPLTNLLACSLSVTAPMLAGARVTSLPPRDSAAAVRIIEGDGVTMMVGDPALFDALAGALEARGASLDAPSLRVCICDGIPSDALLHRWRALTGTELRAAFGIAEAPFALFNVPHFPNRHGTLGIPCPGTYVSVCDPSGEPVPAGAEGELWLRGRQLFSGYLHGAPGGLAMRGPWLQTHERARERPDGTFEHVG